MTAIIDPTAEPPSKPSRRNRWLIGAAVVAAGIGAVVLAKSDVAIPFGSAAGLMKDTGNSAGGPSSISARASTGAHSVAAHAKQQAYGPGWGMRRPIQIDAYSRGVRNAA